MFALLDLLTITITGFMIGNEIAIAAFVHPSLSGLPPRTHLGAARPVAFILGRYMPFWYGLGLLALLAELFLRHTAEPAFHLLLVAAFLWAAAIVFTVVQLVPRNNRIAAADPDQPYASWQADRLAWDRAHRLRVVVLTVAFTLLLVAVLSR